MPAINGVHTLRTSYARFEGASSRGSTATAIVVFTSLVTNRDAQGAWTITTDAALGTRITMLKSGKISSSSSLVVTSGSLAITKNQANLTAFPASSSEIITASANGVAANNSAGTGGEVDVVAGDVIRVCCNATPVANVQDVFNIMFKETTF